MHFLQHQHLAKGWAQWRGFVEQTFHMHALLVHTRPPPSTPPVTLDLAVAVAVALALVLALALTP